MNWIIRNKAIIFFAIPACFALYFYYRMDAVKHKLDATKIQNINQDSRLNKAENYYLKKEIKLIRDTLNDFKNLASQLDSVVKNGNKKDKKIINHVNEKIALINSLTPTGKDSVLARRGLHPKIIKGGY